MKDSHGQTACQNIRICTHIAHENIEGEWYPIVHPDSQREALIAELAGSEGGAMSIVVSQEYRDALRGAVDAKGVLDGIRALKAALDVEREARKRAEDAAFNAGIEAAAKYIEGVAEYPYALPLADSAKSILSLMPDGIRALSKPTEGTG